jgi:hypothetical protein
MKGGDKMKTKLFGLTIRYNRTHKTLSFFRKNERLMPDGSYLAGKSLPVKNFVFHPIKSLNFISEVF